VTLLPAPFNTPRTEALAAFILALAAILGAWGSQLFGGLIPCELCLLQRQPYYIGLPLLALVLLVWPRLSPALRSLGLGLVALVFVWGTGLGVYHSGVEWGFWPGPTACTGLGGDLNFADLNNVNATRVVPCDKVQFRFLGLSLAGYNALVALAVVILTGRAALAARTQGSSSLSQ
jgi:disulfide bond formation protein DsbB